MLEIILPNHTCIFDSLHALRPNCSQNLVSFSDPVMHTYHLPTEMAQEQASLVLSVLILLVKQLMEDPLNHRVNVHTVQSQALSCSPAVHAITCHGGVNRVQVGDLFTPQREQPLGWYPRLLPASSLTSLCASQLRNPIPYLTMFKWLISRF